MIQLGPENGTLTVRTGKAGAAAKAGHNLVLEVQRWRATFAPDEVTLTADARSFKVVSGSGGVSPLGPEEKAGIVKTIDQEVLRGGPIEFRSESVSDALEVRGELNLLGAKRPVSFTLQRDGDRLTGSAALKQSDFGIKPYSALFGTLKVADVVEVEIDVTLPKEP
jgi:hypothetical protein